jgi:hypothetical protein
LKKNKRLRSGRKYPRRRLWIARRNAVFARAGFECEVSGLKLWWQSNADEGVWKRAADHIFPERWCRRFCKAADPHVLENLICITPALHAQKTAVEWRIFRGDLLGYKQELNQLGFSPEMLDRALTAIVGSVK